MVGTVQEIFRMYGTGLMNSLLISVISATGSILAAFPAAYVFAKGKFRGKNILFYLYIVIMIVPFQVVALPQYMAARTLRTYDTLWAMILPGVFSPFSVFLLTQIMKTIPEEELDAARLETNSAIVILSKILLPRMKAGLLCTWVLTFTEMWNAVAEPLVLLESTNRYPLSVLLAGEGAIGPSGTAATIIFLLIPFAIYLIFGKQVLYGLSEYRLK